ncbi:DUF721 domain-containing protein [Yoonia litorea]|uniref:RNA-binding protein n=1 Tax=Yoonia litorea TaxID=1123755 RepID=A0A1I6MX57_9RHOB|nr:DUF721 domain-containing protein [Yoonia litorea]SFS20138.1 hypothetical protein SAMN05444714_2491 [Yoonia litorea]
MKAPRHSSTTRGFSRASTLMQDRIRKASEERGFAVSRLLTHWAEVVGSAVADVATPVNVTYSKGGMGATLTLLTTGSHAPMVEMQKEQIREKVNACYGYRAISRVRITQTAPTGFSDGHVTFKPAVKRQKAPSEAMQLQAKDLSRGVESDALRAALIALGANVLNKRN